MSDADPSATLATLTSSLTALEWALAPLLAKPLDQHLENEDPLVQACAQVLASYVVHDLIWVYLKTAGVDPAAHPVMAEIERLKTYFGKLKGAERGVPAAGETPARTRMQIDRNAASRFINAAIASQRAQVDPGYTPAEGEDAEAGPSGTHTRFSEDEDAEEEVEAVGRAEVDALLEDRPEDEEESPAVEEGEAMEVELVVVQEEPSAGTPAKGKGKEAGKGKKRKSLDPFAGYDQPKPSTPRSATSAPKAKAPKSVDSPRTRSRTEATSSSGSGASTPTGAGAAGEERVSKNARKKLRMKQGAK